VGRATTRAVVTGSILVLITNYIQTDLVIRFGGPFVDWLRGLF
jgi:ABC-type transporter Mla maintaining outer membrane lipid asymmetry permease subunit MlaE